MSKGNEVLDQNKGLLSKWGILALGIGGSIGSGVITLLGSAIGMTGHSAWLAFLLALIMGSIGCIPIAFVSSAVCLYGGQYALVTTMLGKKMAGIFSVTWFLNFPGVVLYALAIAEYLNSLFPGLPKQETAIIIITAFTIYNMLGLSATDKLQKVLTSLLLVGLGLFIIVGLGKVDFSTVTPITNPNFMTNGWSGLFGAAFLLMYAVSQSHIMGYSRLAKNPRRSIPFAIGGATIVLFIVYVLMGVVAACVLPIEVVANQPLTFVAQEILPAPLFIFFMITGPLMALATSLNSCFINYSEPTIVAVNDGWFSKKLAATNKRGAYWVLYLIIYLCMVVPIFLGWDINMAANASLLIWGIGNVLQYIALAVIPNKYPKAWAKRHYGKKCPMWAFYLLIALAIAAQVAMVWSSIINVAPYIVVITVVAIAIAIPYSIYKVNRGDITAVEIDVEDTSGEE